MPTVPLLQTSADSAASQIAGAASALVPTGVVLPFAGSSAPAGWLLCSGQEISQTTYADLYAVLSTAYNLQINPTTGIAWAAPAGGNFRVPDYRGSFLRGVGTPSVGDAVTLGGHQAQKTAKNGLSNTSSTVTGTITAASGLSNTNNIISSTDTKSSQGNTTFAAPGFIAIGSATATSAVLAHSHTMTHVLTAPAQTISGDNETRPINKGVNYIIKT
jgi:microcystin-dependent protein